MAISTSGTPIRAASRRAESSDRRGTVRVPGGGEPVEVGHGTHEWTVGDPYARRSPLPAEPSIRQLIDHEPGWDRVVAAAREAGVAAGEAELADRLERHLDRPASELVDAVTAGGLIPGAPALRALLNSVVSSRVPPGAARG